MAKQETYDQRIEKQQRKELEKAKRARRREQIRATKKATAQIKKKNDKK